MFIKCVMTIEMLDLLKLNKKRDLADISSNKSNVLNVDGKIIIKFPKSLDNVQK